MKKLIFILLGFIPCLLFGQVKYIAYLEDTVGGIGRGKISSAYVSNTKILISITSANILAGDSIPILPAPGSNLVDIVTNISGLLTHGTTYTKTGTDTTWVYSYNGTTKVKLTYLLNTFILNTVTSVGYSPILSPNISLNKPIWIKLASGFATGTGTLKLVLYYKTENFN
jgi:hypothetical protein